MSVVIQHKNIRVVTFQKCGHTSIINMFQTPADQAINRGASPNVYVSKDEEAPVFYKGTDTDDWPDAEITIAFFRNPLQRAYSAYQHFIIRTLSNELVSVPSLGRKQFTELGFTAGMTFLEFCEHLKTVDLDYDPHLRPQITSFVAAKSGFDIINQLENIHRSWPELVEDFNMSCTKAVVYFNSANYDPWPEDSLEGHIIRSLYDEDYHTWDMAL